MDRLSRPETIKVISNSTVCAAVYARARAETHTDTHTHTRTDIQTYIDAVVGAWTPTTAKMNLENAK